MLNTTSNIARLKILCSGVCSLILAMGIARFAYTPLLPVMVQEANLSYAGGGWLAAINYSGYLTGVIIASFISNTILKDRLYRYGMIVAVVSTAMMGITPDFTIWAISRFIAGLSSAAGLMLGSGLILNWLIRHNHRSELGIHFSGIGFGIAACSAAAIFMVQDTAWDAQWFILAALGVLLLIPALAWFPPPPTDEITLKFSATMRHAPPNAKFMRLFTAAYFCAGFGYVVTATFIVSIVNTIPALADKGGWVFLVIGLIAAPSCILWDFVARKTGDVNALVIAGTLEVVGIITPVFGWGMAGAMIGAVLYGATAIAIVSLTLTMAGRYYPAQPAKMMGKMTIAYGVAQIIAPAITGWIAHSQGGYEVGIYIAAIVMAIGTILFYLMRKVGTAA
jgi:MFS family permease